MDHGTCHHRASEEVPPLDGLFRSLNRRLRFLVACRGAALTLATLVLLAVLSCAGDWWFRIDQPLLRAAMALTIIAASAWLALKLAVRPLLRRYDIVDLALEVEQLRPEWRGALASSVEFSAAGCSPRQGAPALQRQLVARTVAQWSAAERHSLIDPTPCRRALGLAFVACVLAMAAAASDRGRAGVALQRLFSPYACPDWPQRHRLALLDAAFALLRDPHVPLHFAAGVPATLYVDDVLTRLPEDVTLHLAHDGGQVRQVPLQPVYVSDSVGRKRMLCQATLPPNARSYLFRVTGGDDNSMPWYTIAFSPRPDVRNIQASLRPPRYLAQPEQTDDAVRGTVEVFVGTHVRLNGTSNVPLQSAVFRRDGRAALPLALSPDGFRFSVEFDVTDAERFSWWFDLTDRHGLRSHDPRRNELRGVEDAVPVVAIERPAADLTATPGAEVPMRILARDDVGVTRARLMLADPPGSVGERALPLNILPSTRVEPDVTLPLAELALAAGRQLTLRAEAEDAFDLGPRHVGRSSSRQLTIVTPEEKRQELLARQAGLVQGLERAGGLQSRSLQQTRELRLQWQAARSFQPADVDLLKRVLHDHSRIVAELHDHERGVAPRTRALLEEFHWNRIDDPAAARRLQHLVSVVDGLLADVFPASERSLDRARRLIDADAAEGDAAEIESSLDAAAAAQLDAADTLDALLALFAEWQRQYDLTRRSDEIAASQKQLNLETAAAGRRTLTRRFSDLSPQDQADLARLGDRQTQLSKTVQRFAESIDQLLADSAQNGQGLSETELRGALEVVRGQSIAEQMQRSGELIAENRIGETLRRQQEVQRSLEELEQVLRGLGVPDPETLLKQVRQAEQDVETLRQQQADALRRTTSLAGPGRSNDPDGVEALQQQQRSLAGQTLESARRLRRQQFLGPAGSASRASDAMQRAADLLQDEAVTESTDAQQDALDSLVQTQRDLADLRRQLEINRSTTRVSELAAMVQALEHRQQGVRDETARLDALQRQRGSLSRSQLSALRQLTDSQTQLADDVKPIEESVIDAPVLNLALAAAAAEMRAAVSRLAERLIDAPTQAAQDRALRWLRELHEVLVQAQQAARAPDETSVRVPGNHAIPDLTLVAQVRLIARMQADLGRRTASLTDLARQTPEFTPEQRTELTLLAAEQLRLTELLAGLLPRQDQDPAPGGNEATP